MKSVLLLLPALIFFFLCSCSDNGASSSYQFPDLSSAGAFSGDMDTFSNIQDVSDIELEQTVADRDGITVTVTHITYDSMGIPEFYFRVENTTDFYLHITFQCCQVNGIGVSCAGYLNLNPQETYVSSIGLWDQYFGLYSISEIHQFGFQVVVSNYQTGSVLFTQKATVNTPTYDGTPEVPEHSGEVLADDEYLKISLIGIEKAKSMEISRVHLLLENRSAEDTLIHFTDRVVNGYLYTVGEEPVIELAANTWRETYMDLNTSEIDSLTMMVARQVFGTNDVEEIQEVNYEKTDKSSNRRSSSLLACSMPGNELPQSSSQ